jgi:hypothetical protein
LARESPVTSREPVSGNTISPLVGSTSSFNLVLPSLSRIADST